MNELNLTPEQAEQVNNLLTQFAPVKEDNFDDEGYMTEDHPDYCVDCHVARLINQVTVNTLSAEGTISNESAQTLLILENIRKSRLAD